MGVRKVVVEPLRRAVARSPVKFPKAWWWEWLRGSPRNDGWLMELGINPAMSENQTGVWKDMANGLEPKRTGRERLCLDGGDPAVMNQVES